MWFLSFSYNLEIIKQKYKIIKNNYFLLLHLQHFFFLSISTFIVVQVQLSPFSPHHSPLLHPSPALTLEPIPFVLSLCPSYLFLDGPSPIFSHYPSPPPLWLLSICSLFQCFWLYFACLSTKQTSKQNINWVILLIL